MNHFVLEWFGCFVWLRRKKRTMMFSQLTNFTLKQRWTFIIFLIRNEEDYINKRTNTEEKKETKEREKKTKGRMRGPSYTITKENTQQ